MSEAEKLLLAKGCEGEFGSQRSKALSRVTGILDAAANIKP